MSNSVTSLPRASGFFGPCSVRSVEVGPEGLLLELFSFGLFGGLILVQFGVDEPFERAEVELDRVEYLGDVPVQLRPVVEEWVVSVD